MWDRAGKGITIQLAKGPVKNKSSGQPSPKDLGLIRPSFSLQAYVAGLEVGRLPSLQACKLGGLK